MLVAYVSKKLLLELQLRKYDVIAIDKRRAVLILLVILVLTALTYPLQRCSNVTRA
jgi:hypothetical protein